MKASGARILAQTLSEQGVERISSVAGESYLAVLDALLDYPAIQIITNRHEGGAAFMAESWGKLTGKPGVCFVTRGPGASNAAIGVHTAMQDSTPLILFMGQVRRMEKGREAFQEIDVGHVFGPLAKWTAEITDPARIPEIINRAFHVAMSGRPGPVVIALPEDMLREEADTPTGAPIPAAPSHVHAADIARITDTLAKAQRPVALVGGSGWTDEACEHFMSFAKSCHLPVATSFRRQDIFNHRNNCYVGELGTGPNPQLVARLKDADTILVVGARLNEITTQGYTLLDSPYPRQTLIHVHPGADEIGKVYTPAIALVADINNFTAALAAGHKPDGRIWSGWRDELRALYTAWTAIDTATLPSWQGADVTAIYAWLRDNLPPDAIITTDAGNFSGWAQRYLPYGRPGRLLAPISGAMGYAVPAAVGAAIAAPDRLTLGLCGDGGFMMTANELATAMHHKAAPLIMVCNNNMYGTIRMHQERAYPGRHSATALTNPDFVALARSFGAYGARVDDAADFPAVWDAARAAGTAAVIEVRMDPRQITTNARPS